MMDYFQVRVYGEQKRRVGSCACLQAFVFLLDGSLSLVHYHMAFTLPFTFI